MVENNILFLNLDFKMECILSFSHSFDDKNFIFIRSIQDHIHNRPTQYFQRACVESGSIWQELPQNVEWSFMAEKKTSGHHRLKFWSLQETRCTFLWFVLLVFLSRSFEYEKKKIALKLWFLHRDRCKLELVVFNLFEWSCKSCYNTEHFEHWWNKKLNWIRQQPTLSPFQVPSGSYTPFNFCPESQVISQFVNNHDLITNHPLTLNTSLFLLWK